MDWLSGRSLRSTSASGEMPKLSQHHHGMLRRLRLELMGGGDVGHKRYMDEHAVPWTEITTHLTCGLHERLRFDVTHCAADLGDDHVDVIGGLRTHTGFDLVRDMRDHLHALAEVLTSAFLAKLPPDRSGRW